MIVFQLISIICGAIMIPYIVYHLLEDHSKIRTIATMASLQVWIVISSIWLKVS